MSTSRLIQIIRDEGSKLNPSLPMIGEVVGTDPLKIESNGITLDDDQLYIVHTIYPDEIGILTPDGSTNEYRVKLKSPFSIGQTVVLLPTQNSSRYVVLKVVNV